ncbi:MAG TPA: histidine phosphatase family protein [Candidatus Limnocylindria bacterium]|nr:histidine phosphatase family protein [Candidatus Limnocylindria bacterium]
MSGGATGSTPAPGRLLLLVRHGVTDWNREGRFQGHMDPPLADAGRRQAELLGERLARTEPRPQLIVASPLDRALHTARLIATALRETGDPPRLVSDGRLMEIGQGDWEGRTHAELAVEDAERYAAWRTSGTDLQPPNAEPIDDAYRRVGELLDEVLPSAAEHVVCLVSHGGTLRLLALRLLELSVARTWEVDLDNASLSQLTSIEDAHAPGGGWRLDRWNDVRHLLGRMPTHVDESEGSPLAL